MLGVSPDGCCGQSFSEWIAFCGDGDVGPVSAQRLTWELWKISDSISFLWWVQLLAKTVQNQVVQVFLFLLTLGND
jgi:hypothetical protein